MSEPPVSRRLPAPWRVVERSESYVIEDASGQALAHVYFEDNPGRRNLTRRLTSDEAWRVASNIAKLPELLAKEKRIAAVRVDLESRADALMGRPEGSEAATLELIAAVIDAIDGPKT
jgi:hypothetical protein